MIELPEWTSKDVKVGKLTRETLKKAFDWLESPEYAKQIQKRRKAESDGIKVLDKAREMELITDNEYLHWFGTIFINGFLCVDQNTYKKIQPAIDLLP